jgi:hypothetical protein
VNKWRLGRILPRRFEQVHRPHRVHIKIHQRDLGCLVMRRLRGAMDDRVELVLTEQSKDVLAVPDIEIEVLELVRRLEETIAVPRRIALLTKKDRTHVVVDADNLVPLAVEERHGLRPDQPT